MHLRTFTFHSADADIYVDIFHNRFVGSAWNKRTDVSVEDTFIGYCAYCVARIVADKVNVSGAHIPDDCLCD